MNKQTRLLAAFVLVIAGLFGENVLDFVKKNVDINVWPKSDTPTVVVDEPSLQYQDMVQDVVALDIKKEHADVIAPFFYEVASVIETDPGFLKTTGQFRDFNVMAGQLQFAGTEIKGAYPQLGEKVDTAIIAAIGRENVSLTDEKRSSLVSILKAIAWSIHQ